MRALKDDARFHRLIVDGYKENENVYQWEVKDNIVERKKKRKDRIIIELKKNILSWALEVRFSLSLHLERIYFEWGKKKKK